MKKGEHDNKVINMAIATQDNTKWSVRDMLVSVIEDIDSSDSETDKAILIFNSKSMGRADRIAYRMVNLTGWEMMGLLEDFKHKYLNDV